MTPPDDSHNASTRSDRRRVLITGLGPVSSIGHGSHDFAQALRRGERGIGPISAFDATGFPTALAGEITDLSARDYVPKSYRKATKVMARDIELAVVAARLAVTDARLATRDAEATEGGHPVDAKRTGCQIGAGFIAAEIDELALAMDSSKSEGEGLTSWDLKKWGTEGEGAGGMNNLPPLWLLKYLPNMLACHVTIIHGLEGPSNTITCAQSSGLLSIGEGARVIERDDADLCVSGGAESKINLLGLMRFDLAGRMAHPPAPETPAEDVVRPFDDASHGSVMGEGGGLVVLEHEGHALARGARVYAEVSGFGAGQSTSPYLPGVMPEPDPDEPEGGQLRAIRAALDDAGLEPGDIDAVIPTACGVPALDRSEMATLRAVFGTVPPLVTLADRVGDCLAGHAGLAACAAASMLHDRAWPEGAYVHGGGALPDSPPRAILITTHAIGGPAAAAVFTAYDQPNT